jgi:hypothetical protein
VIQRSAAVSALRSTWQVRTRPTFREETTPLASSTARCCITAGSEIASGFASSLTVAGPRESLCTIARRVGSLSAWKVRSRTAACMAGSNT